MLRGRNRVSRFNEQTHQPRNGRQVVGIVMQRLVEKVDRVVAKSGGVERVGTLCVDGWSSAHAHAHA
jgi:hypothetical protein